MLGRLIRISRVLRVVKINNVYRRTTTIRSIKPSMTVLWQMSHTVVTVPLRNLFTRTTSHLTNPPRSPGSMNTQIHSGVAFKRITFVLQQRRRVFTPLPPIQTDRAGVSSVPRVNVINRPRSLQQSFGRHKTVFLRIGVADRMGAFHITNRGRQSNN